MRREHRRGLPMLRGKGMALNFWSDRAWLAFAIGAIALLVVLAIVIPLAFIWALNTLFHLGIEFNFWTWLAAFIILIIIASSFSVVRSRCD